MRRTVIRRLAVLVVVVAALAAVAAVAYSLGVGNAHDTDSMRGMPFRGHDVGWGYGWGFGILGLLGFVLVGVLAFWLIAALLSPGASGPAGPAQADVERLRELSEMHTRGDLTDDEFAAAKRKLLGIQ